MTKIFKLVYPPYLECGVYYTATLDYLNLKFKEAFEKNSYEDFTEINEKLLGKHLTILDDANLIS